MAQKKYYVVWKGIKTGVFTSWTACKKNIEGVPGAQYKSFANKEMAEKAFKGTYEEYKGTSTKKKELSAEEKKAYGKPILNSIAVDAACSGNPGVMEYQGVDTKTKEQLFHMKFSMVLSEMVQMKNTLSKFLEFEHKN